MKIEVKDIYGTEISLGFSRSGYYRFDLSGKSFPEDDDGLGNKIGKCVSLNEDAARILYHALKIMIEGEH